MQTKTTIQFRQHFNALLNLLLPQQCLLCRWVCFDRGLCADCWQWLVFITSPFCQRCGQLLAYAIGDHLCGSCFAKAPPLLKIRSCFLYNGRSRQLILKKMVARFISTPYLPAFYKRFSPPRQKQAI
jgi:predicted amidophosphoribosyltransferase